MIKIGTKEELSIEIGNLISNKVKEKPFSKLLLATGSSPIEIYKQMIKKHKEGISFKNVHTFNLDEYLDIDVIKNKISFRNFMNEKLFNAIDIDKKNTFFPKDTKEYNEKLDEINYFDIGIIGVGTNGHIAFNEPPAEYNRTNIIKLSQSTINSNFKGMDQYPTRAITMGMKDIIEKTDTLILIIWGKNKQNALNAYYKALEKNKIDINWPITYLIRVKNLLIFTDLKK